MKTIRVYRNPDCARCARFERVGRFFDWLHRVDYSTDPPRSGPLEVGEVVVEDLATGELHTGADGIDMIWRQIPVYRPFRPLLRMPHLRRRIDRQVSRSHSHGHA